ncbi:MAG TPA: hypothetical protein DIW31_10695 [Bacteroidales bacterium]|nr:hypothetical protein [Bacteroidales bacterium]
MKTRLLLIVGAIILFSNFALAQYTDVVIPENNKAAADINNTTTTITETYTNQSDLFLNSKNELNTFNSSASVGTSLLLSKYVSVYNVPIGYSFRSKLFFRNNNDVYENLSFKVVIPIIQKKYEAFDMVAGEEAEYKTTGLGDVIVKANYNMIKNSMIFSFGVRAKLATGKTKNMVRDHDVPLGTGSTDIDLSLFFSKNFGSKFSAHSSFEYELKTDFEKDGITYEYGNKMNALVGGDYLFKFAKLGVELSFTSSENTKADFAGFSSEIPGITAMDAIPYVKVNLTETMDAKFFGLVPVISKWKSIDGLTGIPDPDRKVRIGFMFSYRFVKKSE